MKDGGSWPRVFLRAWRTHDFLLFHVGVHHRWVSLVWEFLYYYTLIMTPSDVESKELWRDRLDRHLRLVRRILRWGWDVEWSDLEWRLYWDLVSLWFCIKCQAMRRNLVWFYILFNISSSAHLHVFTNLHTETSEMGTSASMMFRSV